MWPVDHPLSPTSKHDIAWTLQICPWSHSAHEWFFFAPPIFPAPCKEAAVEAEGIARSQGCHRSRNNDHGIATSLCTYLILTRWKVWTLWQLWPLATPCSSNCHSNVVDGWDFFPPIWSKSWMNATCSFGFGHLCRIFAQLYCDSAIRAPLTTAPTDLTGAMWMETGAARSTVMYVQIMGKQMKFAGRKEKHNGVSPETVRVEKRKLRNQFYTSWIINICSIMLLWWNPMKQTQKLSFILRWPRRWPGSPVHKSPQVTPSWKQFKDIPITSRFCFCIIFDGCSLRNWRLACFLHLYRKCIENPCVKISWGGWAALFILQNGFSLQNGAPCKDARLCFLQNPRPPCWQKHISLKNGCTQRQKIMFKGGWVHPFCREQPSTKWTAQCLIRPVFWGQNRIGSFEIPTGFFIRDPLARIPRTNPWHKSLARIPRTNPSHEALARNLFGNRSHSFVSHIALLCSSRDPRSIQYDLIKYRQCQSVLYAGNRFAGNTGLVCLVVIH